MSYHACSARFTGGDAAARRPYQEQTMPLQTELVIYLAVVFYRYVSPNGLSDTTLASWSAIPQSAIRIPHSAVAAVHTARNPQSKFVPDIAKRHKFCSQLAQIRF